MILIGQVNHRELQVLEAAGYEVKRHDGSLVEVTIDCDIVAFLCGTSLCMFCHRLIDDAQSGWSNDEKCWVNTYACNHCGAVSVRKDYPGGRK